MSELLFGRHHSPGGRRSLQALRSAQEEGDTAIQLFASGRLNRAVSDPPEDELDEIRELSGKIWCLTHAAYTLNLCAAKSSDLARVSRSHLLRSLRWSERVGFRAVNFHPGSAMERDPRRARESLVENCRMVMSRYDGPVHLLLENSAGDRRGRVVGADIRELLDLSSDVGDSRCGVCVDTVHAWAAGESLKASLNLISDARGIVRAVHLNAPAPGIKRGSHSDRHGSARESEWVASDLIKAIRSLALTNPELPLVMETKDATDPAWIRAQLKR